MCVFYMYGYNSMYDVGQSASQVKSHMKSVSFELIKVVNVQHFPSTQHVSWANFYVIKLFNSYFLLY